MNQEQLTEINAGGTHQDSPLGGVPMGIGPNGQPNLVEQGETKLNSDDYIFSDTLKVDKEVAEQFNLPKTVVGKTFADVSKKLNKPNSRREGDTIEQLDIKKGLDKLMNAQEAFKQFEVQRKLEEINSLDPSLLGSMMNQGQPMGMQPQQQQAEQLQQPIDPSMVQQMTDENGGAPMMKLGGYMYGNGGGLNYTVSNPNNLPQPSTEFQYPASAREAIVYPSAMDAQTALMKGENDTTRTYFQVPNTQVMGEFVGNEDVNNPNFQDWGPNKSTGIIRKNVFFNDPNTPDINEVRDDVFPDVNSYDLGGWLQDNKQGVLGGLQAAAGIGAMFIPGAQGLGTNLITGGAKNIMGEVVQDNQPNPNAQQVVQNTNLPMGINFKYGGNMYALGGPFEENFLPNVKPVNLTQQPIVQQTTPYPTGMLPNIDPITGLDLNAIPTTTIVEDVIVDSNDDDYYNTENLITTTGRLEGETEEQYQSRLAKANENLNDNNVNLDIKQKPWELALQGLPVAYNVGRGLFEKPMQLKESDYMQKPIEAYKMNVDPQLAATREAYAGATAGLKNNMPGLGAYLTNRSSIANSEAQAKRDIYAGKENADNQLQLNADIQNAQLLGQNNQNKMAIQQFNAQAKEAKKQLLGAGLVQGSQIGRASVDTNLQKEMMKLVAPSFTEWLKTQNKSKG